MTNDMYRTAQGARPVNGEIVDKSPIFPVEILPRSALNDNLQPSFSIRNVIDKARVKAEISRAAYDIFKQGYVTAMAQDMDLALYAKGLNTAAKKNAFLAKHIEGNKELARALHEQVVAYIEQMSDQQVEYVMHAELRAQQQIGDTRNRVEAGHLPESRADSMLNFIEHQRSEKIRRMLEHSDRELNGLSEMAARAQSTVLKSIENRT